MTTHAQASALVGSDEFVPIVQMSVAIVAQSKIVPLRLFSGLCRCRGTEIDMTFIAFVGGALLLEDVEMHRVLGEPLVLYLRCRLLLHLVVARCAILLQQLGALDLVVMTVLARGAIGVTYVAVIATDAWIRLMIRQPIGGMRHHGLVTALA